MAAITARLARRVFWFFAAVQFRLKHRVWRGTVRLDAPSLKSLSWGAGTILRGTIAASNARLNIGSGAVIARDSSVGAEFGAEAILGKSVVIGERTIVSISMGSLRIGDRTTFFSDCLISGEVQIGADCLFAKNVSLLTGTHEIRGSGTIRENDALAEASHRSKPIVIGDDCWLGLNSVILPGVTLGTGCVVGANAVVTMSFPPYSILGGVPAIKIGSRVGHESS
jgi:acetyltransferase-like isoleucine patch superfamily enzyme